MLSQPGADDLDRAVQEQIEALAEAIDRERPHLLPLDRSYASLDRVEEFYRSKLESAGAASAGTLESQLEAYVGATLAAATGGTWDRPRTRGDMNRRSLVSLPHLKRARFYPLDVVRTFRRTRSPGYLRDGTEIYDIPKRRADLEHLTADGGAVIGRLHADLTAVLGRAPGPLDGSPASIAAVEDALRKLIAENAPLDLIRRMEDGAVLYVGQIAQHAVGGDWTVSEDPDADDVGQFRMHGWAPVTVIRNVGPQSRPNILQAALDLAIKGRGTK